MRITAASVQLLKDEAQADLLAEIFKGLTKYAEINSMSYVLEILIEALDNADDEDGFGTEGWRHSFGLDD